MTAHKVKLLHPRPPNFIRIDGFGDATIRVADLSHDQRDELATEWRRGLDEVAERQKGSGENQMKTATERLIAAQPRDSKPIAADLLAAWLIDTQRFATLHERPSPYNLISSEATKRLTLQFVMAAFGDDDIGLLIGEIFEGRVHECSPTGEAEALRDAAGAVRLLAEKIASQFEQAADHQAEPLESLDDRPGIGE